MEELKKLYQAREILATTEHGVSDDLQQRISLLEQETIRKRFIEFIQEANKLFNGIESPIDFILAYNPNEGVSISFRERSETQQQNIVHQPRKNETVAYSHRNSFVKYISSLDISDGSKRRYIKHLNSDLISTLLQEYAHTDNLEQVTDKNIIYAMMYKLSKKEGEEPHRVRSVLSHYIKYLDEIRNRQ